MVRYMALIQLTDKGAREISDSAKRAADFSAHVAAAGGTVTSQYWAIGEFDGAVVFDAPTDEAAAHLLLELAQGGFVRTQSLRLFTPDEFQHVIAN
ncbi:MAG: GYD domain-containing protein [Planctomycetales bacterium]|nr:GYD domain-containing protein [Planctomycetales bacterium]